MNSYKDQLFGALVGLARASESKVITETAGEAYIAGLKIAYDPEATESEIMAMIDRLHEEKKLMAPDCAACQYPCGRTFDYDMEEVYGASEALREAKLALFSALGTLAFLDHETESMEVRQFVSDSLFQISCTYESGQLSKPMEQAQAFINSLK